MQTWPNWKQFNRCVFARHTLNNKFICHFAQNLHKGIAKKKIAMNTSIVSDPSSKNCLNLPWILFLLRLHNVVIFHFFSFLLVGIILKYYSTSGMRCRVRFVIGGKFFWCKSIDDWNCNDNKWLHREWKNYNNLTNMFKKVQFLVK